MEDKKASVPTVGHSNTEKVWESEAGHEDLAFGQKTEPQVRSAHSSMAVRYLVYSRHCLLV